MAERTLRRKILIGLAISPLVVVPEIYFLLRYDPPTPSPAQAQHQTNAAPAPAAAVPMPADRPYSIDPNDSDTNDPAWPWSPMMKTLLAGTPATRAAADDARTFLNPCDGFHGDDRDQCNARHKNFILFYVAARGGDHKAQVNVAWMLFYGAGPSEPGIMANAEASCAWSAIAQDSGSDASYDTDHSNMQERCGDLTSDQLAAARTIADHIAREITDAPASLPKSLRDEE